MTISPARRWDGEMRLVMALAVLVAVSAFVFYFQHNCILLFGDAVAHINIARRVFDSKTPGLLQLGTVWLPLPHLLMIPFLIPMAAWQTGVGGSIPSILAYVFTVAGTFRLVRGALCFGSDPDGKIRMIAWFAALIVGANPNLIYVQTTAMTEVIYLALFIWAMVHLEEFVIAVRQGDENIAAARSSLIKCGLCLFGAEWTRYDGWFAGVFFALAAVVMTFLIVENGAQAVLRRTLVKFLLIVVTAPMIWLAYNWIIYRNPLEFANGPYSARAIEKKSATPGFPPHPGSRDLVAAARYFLRSAEDNVAEGFLPRVWLVAALGGTFFCVFLDRRLLPLLLLWLPLPFYASSVAYGGVPIFVPTWWPFSYYNVRYGIELLPAMAVFLAVGVYSLIALTRFKVGRVAVGALAVTLVAVSYVTVWRARPVAFREAWANSRTRIALERELAANLRKLPPDSTLLMYLGDHPGALQTAGIPLSHVVQEGNHRTWKQPTDPAGLWERGLGDPAAVADFAIGIDDDPVSRSARLHALIPLAVVHTLGQPAATIYATHKP